MRRHGTQEQLAEILTQRLPAGTEPKMALLAAGALIAVVTTIFEFWVEDFDDAEMFTLMDRALEAVIDGFGLGGRSVAPPQGLLPEAAEAGAPPPQPLRPAVAMPPRIPRCTRTRSTAEGTAAKMAAAIRSGHCDAYWPRYW